MSLPTQSFDVIPVETVGRVAQAAFPRRTRFMQMRDTLGTIYDHPTLEALYPSVANRPKPRGGSLSSRSCNLLQTCRIVRQPTRFAVALTGSMR